ncbi:pectin lyase [Colletotrichum truncatum]|uniref:Pectin lyase n=1 Tax=Colletotrichum truncatum TaxID=5467 RepID=A0ACC3YEN4_COLTU|nr:pectin lyase [Colletotrichum truncatum]KAF6783263.1 pectin lyase [Colletotrichum truncatum]
MHFITALSVALAPAFVAAQMNRTAYGFAAGVTGGGSAKAAAPKDIKELASWLSDSTPRVILIDKTFDFVGSEGSTTDSGCTKKTCTMAQGGQNYIGTLSCGDSEKQSAKITYDKAGTTALTVGPNKSIVGVGSQGVISGKGLKLPKTSKNVIIQNVHITNINPESVWGGDAIQLEGNDGVWIDHCKFSKVGRMFVVAHYNANRLTISNTEFDGVTKTSATCNKNHYWTVMFITDGDKITLDRNYWHDLSGRAPKLGQDGVSTTVHATNNYFANMAGHAFDIYPGTSALIEGNVFEKVEQPMTDNSAKVNTVFNAPDSGSLASCSSSLGRACVANSLSGSGTFTSMTSTAGLSNLAKVKTNLVKPKAASSVKSMVMKGAGIGKI